MTTTLRSQEDILKRYLEAINERTEAEALEYLRQMEYVTSLNIFGGAGLYEDDEIEDYRDIDHTAKTCLGNLLRNITARKPVHIAACVAQFVAWKWLLGHPDCDKFLGAHGHPPYCDPRRVYVYMREQIEGGEWDRLTKNSLEGLKGKR